MIQEQKPFDPVVLGTVMAVIVFLAITCAGLFDPFVY